MKERGKLHKLKMRDLIFKNFTSSDKRRKVIASSEISDKPGIHTIIRRHFACIVKEAQIDQAERPAPYLYILKYRNTQERKEKFFCRLKGSFYTVSKGKSYLVLYMHSLKVDLTATAHNSVRNTFAGE